MQIFELSFNPKAEEKISETFHYKPKNVYERKIGSFYMIGEISGAQKKETPLLQNIFHAAKKSYYKNSSLSPEMALKETLKEINELIKDKEHLPRTSIAVFSSKNFSLYFAKTGEIKIFLLTKEKIKDIGSRVEDSSTRLFSNMISGKMKKEDKIIALTPEIHRSFAKKKVLEKILKNSLDEKVIGQIAALQEKSFPQSTGAVLVMDHSITLKEEGTKLTSSHKRRKKFSFKNFFLETMQSIPSPKKINSPKIKIPEFNFNYKKKIDKKQFLLPVLLFGIILVGVITIGIENRVQSSREQERINRIEERIEEAKNDSDLILMKEVLTELKALKDEEIRFKERVEMLYFSLMEIFLEKSFAKNIDKEDLVYVGNIEKIDPGKMLLADTKIYLFPLKGSDASILNPQTGEESSYLLPYEEKIELSSFSSGKIILFYKPNTLLFIENNSISETEINLPKDHEEFVSLSSFFGRPYFLDSNGRILRYHEKDPISWLKDESKLLKEGVSITIDGSIFALSSSDVIYQYHEGIMQEEIDVPIFPPLTSSTTIYTSPQAPIFLLDKEEKRVVVIDKEENITTQLFFNEALDSLKDIAVTNDGKKIYLLSNKKVYLFEI